MEVKKSTFDKINQYAKKKTNPFADLVLSDILWPILSIAILIVLILFVYIPFGLEIPDYLYERSSINEKLEKRISKKENLDAVSKKSIDAVNDLISETLKSEFDVSSLANVVAVSAANNSLSANKMTLADIPALGFQNVIEEQGKVKGLRSISGVFSYKGTLANINNFLDDLKGASELLVIEELEMQRVPVYNSAGVITGEAWNIDLTLMGYSFSDYTETTYAEPLKELPVLADVKDVLGNEDGSSSEDSSGSE